MQTIYENASKREQIVLSKFFNINTTNITDLQIKIWEFLPTEIIVLKNLCKNYIECEQDNNFIRLLDIAIKNMELKTNPI
jgi:hypothetical protein